MPEIGDQHLKWSHSIVQEPDYCSEWVAAHRATELALQCGTSTFQMPGVNAPDRTKAEGCLSVRFHPLVDVFIGTDDHIHMHSISVPAEVLPHIAKPWSSYHQSRGVNRTLPSFDFDRDVGCPIDQLFTHFAFVGDHLTPHAHDFDANLPSLDCVIEGWNHVSSGLKSAGQDEDDDSSNLHAVPVTDEGLSAGPIYPMNNSLLIGTKTSTSLGDVDPDLACPVPAYLHPSSILNCFGLCCDPLSFRKAVSIPEDHALLKVPSTLDLATQVFTSKVMSNSNAGTCFHAPSAASLALEDHVMCPDSDVPADEGPADASQPRSTASGTSPSRAVSPIRLPPFAQQMMVNLPLQFLTNPVRIVQGFVVRTWYLHHTNIPLSLQARQIMMTGPPHLWRAQILATWTDLIVQGEDLTLDLVSPNPPRNWHEAHILFDLILAQGMYSDRFSGLVTVSPTITEPNLRMYAVAVSFEPVISGQDLVTSAGIQPFCNQFDCLIFHARDQLYIDFNRVHQMQHGHGFVVYLSRRPEPEPAPSVPSEAVSSIDPAPEPHPEQDVDMHPQSVASDPLATDPAVGATADADDLRRVTLYRLNRQTKSAWVRWRQFSNLLQDVLEATSISPADIVALHPLLAKPIGEHANEFSVIVQQRQDIEPGSSDSLVLMDVVFHQQGSVAHMYMAPAVDRKVVRVPQTLTRQGVLQLARVANYCESAGQACLVALNHNPWLFQNAGTQMVLSGCYVRVQVPPATVHGAETCRAASLVEDLFDPQLPSFAQVYPTLPHHAEVNARPLPDHGSSPPAAMHDCVTFCRYPIPRQCHFADQHVAEDPSFEANIPMQFRCRRHRFFQMPLTGMNLISK